jgi:uncharacterized Zn finger protein
MYDVKVTVAPVPRTRWSAICKDCAGAIDSLVELLQGRFSKGVMTRLCEETTGLFPSPKEIIFTCSCPDWASMCKHVAAVLYGIGARLDHQPELLFTLRKVDQQDLIAKAGSDLSKTHQGPAGAKVLESDDLSSMFGIEIAPTTPSRRTAASKITTKAQRKPAPRRNPRKRLLTPAKRRAISERMTKYWAARRALMKKRARPWRDVTREMSLRRFRPEKPLNGSVFLRRTEYVAERIRVSLISCEMLRKTAERNWRRERDSDLTAFLPSTFYGHSTPSEPLKPFET